jgi:NADH:ubiquinone oxidoreductase subunit 4 (subunit M)
LAIFSSALASDNTRYVWVAVIGVINAAISSYYYLRIIGVMYMQDSFTPLVVRSGRAALSVVVCCCLLTLMIGIVPGPLMAWAASAGSLEHVPVPAAGKDGERLFRSNEIVAAQTSKSENASLKQPPSINH